MLFGNPLGAAVSQCQQDRAQLALASQNERYAQYLAFCRFDARCRANFRAHHGFEVPPEENMTHIWRMYSLPWRNTPIPKSGKSRALAERQAMREILDHNGAQISARVRDGLASTSGGAPTGFNNLPPLIKREA